MSVTQPTKINMAVPNYKIDQIIGIKTGSFNIGVPVAGPPVITAGTAFTTGFGDNCFLQGIFSTDGGLSWNDFGTYRPDLTTAFPTLQTVTCYGYVSASGVFQPTGVNWYDTNHAIGRAYTIQYKVFFIAKDTQGAITPIGTSEILYYTSAFNYQKIYLSNNYSSTTGTSVIAHNLGYVPKVRTFFSPTSTQNNADGVSIPAGAMVTLDHYQYATNVQPDTANLTITDVSTSVTPRTTINGQVYYRIYLDS